MLVTRTHAIIDNVSTTRRITTCTTNKKSKKRCYSQFLTASFRIRASRNTDQQQLFHYTCRSPSSHSPPGTNLRVNGRIDGGSVDVRIRGDNVSGRTRCNLRLTGDQRSGCRRRCHSVRARKITEDRREYTSTGSVVMEIL